MVTYVQYPRSLGALAVIAPIAPVWARVCSTKAAVRSKIICAPSVVHASGATGENRLERIQEFRWVVRDCVEHAWYAEHVRWRTMRFNSPLAHSSRSVGPAIIAGLNFYLVRKALSRVDLP